MTEASTGPRERPLSPHLQVWRWHVTMLTSILHRVTGAALYMAAFVLAGWALALASGPESYVEYKALMGSLIGQVVLFAITLAVFYHLANGIRHLFWDTGHGLDLKSANASAWVVFAVAAVASVALWVAAAQMGVL